MSPKSASMAVKMGYTKVKVFEAGYPAWKKVAGAAKKIKIKGGSEEGSINLTVFKRILANDPNSIVLIDVRDPDEFAAGHFKSAINIPSDLLEKKLKTMKITKPIVFVCATGARSGEAYYMVQDIRPDIKEVFYLECTITYKANGKFALKASE
jgi:rhodanese-related sulfurtransferase